MALITCPDCKKIVSDKARVCVNCGYPIQQLTEKKNEIEDIAKNCEASQESLAEIKNRLHNELPKKLIDDLKAVDIKPKIDKVMLAVELGAFIVAVFCLVVGIIFSENSGLLLVLCLLTAAFFFFVSVKGLKNKYKIIVQIMKFDKKTEEREQKKEKLISDYRNRIDSFTGIMNRNCPGCSSNVILIRYFGDYIEGYCPSCRKSFLAGLNEAKEGSVIYRPITRNDYTLFGKSGSAWFRINGMPFNLGEDISRDHCLLSVLSELVTFPRNYDHWVHVNDLFKYEPIDKMTSDAEAMFADILLEFISTKIIFGSESYTHVYLNSTKDLVRDFVTNARKENVALLKEYLESEMYDNDMTLYAYLFVPRADK